MDYTYKLPRGTAAAVLSFMPKAAELPGSGRWQAIGLSHHDTIFISIDESLPCDISRGYGRDLCFIAFYSRAANPNISPFMRYGNSVCIPDDSSPEEIGLAYGVLYEIRKSVGTLETKLVGKSKAMQETRARIMKAVNCRFPVHIDGRTGTGKGIAAVAIHNCRLPNTSYTYGNGADFASSLSESKLFGHHKGAFTGATESSAGLICEANNSTLILDELENMPMEAQPLLLHVLDTGEYRPLGRTEMRKSDFRLITLSNIPLETLVKENKLREDLYYRISCFVIRMPSLCEHMEDIPELIMHWEASHGIHPNDRIMDCDPFMDSPYNGNIRELFRDVGKYHSE